jgi:hypothetical protein
MKAFPILSLSLLSLGACNGGVTWAIPGPVAELDRLKALQTEGKLKEITARPTPAECETIPSGSDSCPQINAIRGRAFLTLAMEQRSLNSSCPLPTPAALSNLDQAVASYALASGAAPLGSADAANVAENRMLAVACAAPFAPPTGARAMVNEALEALDAVPVTASGSLHGASAALNLAQRADLPSTERCAAARNAAARAQRGLDLPADAAARRGLTGTMNAAMQQAAALTNCGGGGA